MTDNFRIILKPSTGTGTNDSETYFYDFNRHPQGLYKLTFKYTGLDNDLDPCMFALLSINFGGINIYETVLNKNPVGSFLVGILNPYIVDATNGYLSANPIDNNPTLLYKPSNNTFTVKVTDLAGVGFLDKSGFVNNDYILDLYFGKL